MSESSANSTRRPAVMGSRFMASTGHPLATAAALRLLEQGGNATDAGVAAGLCLNVVQPEYTNLGGVAPIILFDAATGAAQTISGLGCWPASVDPGYFERECDGDLPAGVRRCVVPAAADAWLTALARFGSRPLAEVAAPAIELATDGFPMYPLLRDNLEAARVDMRRHPQNEAIFLTSGEAPAIGARFRQPDLARTLRKLVEAEHDARSLGHAGALMAARDRFYKGDIAREIAAYVAEAGGFLSRDDLARFSVEVGPAARRKYRGHDVLSCPAWCQGPVVLETLAILEGYDLRALGQHSADGLHLMLEALKAAFADRERYYGDPNFVDVPLRGLLDDGYAAEWRARIDPHAAAPRMPEPGDPWRWEGHAPSEQTDAHRLAPPQVGARQHDTSYVCVVDASGNAFSATPSDGVGTAPIVPGLGFVVSDRGSQSWVDRAHPSSIAPRKRPRLTPSPGLIMRDGRVVAPYGTPGGDVQPQAMVQFVVNLIDFGMDPQAAIEAPRLATFSFPESFHPHAYQPGLVKAERRFSDRVLGELRDRGHRIEMWADWAPEAGALCAVVVGDDGVLLGAADPRRASFAFGR